MRGRELTILEFVEYKGVASGNFEFPKARRGVRIIMQLMVGYGNFLYNVINHPLMSLITGSHSEIKSC